jgi:hypothetical protein
MNVEKHCKLRAGRFALAILIIALLFGCYAYRKKMACLAKMVENGEGLAAYSFVVS